MLLIISVTITVIALNRVDTVKQVSVSAASTLTLPQVTGMVPVPNNGRQPMTGFLCGSKDTVLKFAHVYFEDLSKLYELIAKAVAGKCHLIVGIHERNADDKLRIPTSAPHTFDDGLADWIKDQYLAIAKKYDGHRAIFCIQVGFSRYGETYNHNNPEFMPSPTKLLEVFSAVTSAFKVTRIQVSQDVLNSDIMGPLESLEIGITRTFFLENMDKRNVDSVKAKHPFGGEIGGNVTGDSTFNADLAIEECKRVGFTFSMCNHLRNETASTKRVDQLMRYRYFIAAVASDGKAKTHISLKNTGVAPIYYDSYITMDSGLKSNKSLKGHASDMRVYTIDGAVDSNNLFSIECAMAYLGKEIPIGVNI
ncbi:hypothetical protein SARC_09870 [Sphaeroforma arctica JP610]|uniref:Uncharacterized protein n=1 Tax=Sphaeroforma arctica JP610 TaxID=667725 RepID=A0A0L0FLP0_9EUKA|nr:hypothetical protein SARC_09870 [Sphaeroforma arctica JP610]KNC77670.1 hypothetical protein SARC_09870 [Sphaeroforma arctica JP610]|eukprot:XP_014151572.1 hypothetical protein SARC_09870 [Sphaeroforma arctica JP610]